MWVLWLVAAKGAEGMGLIAIPSLGSAAR